MAYNKWDKNSNSIHMREAILCGESFTHELKFKWSPTRNDQTTDIMEKAHQQQEYGVVCSKISSRGSRGKCYKGQTHWLIPWMAAGERQRGLQLELWVWAPAMCPNLERYPLISSSR